MGNTIHVELLSAKLLTREQRCIAIVIIIGTVICYRLWYFCVIIMNLITWCIIIMLIDVKECNSYIPGAY